MRPPILLLLVLSLALTPGVHGAGGNILVDGYHKTPAFVGGNDKNSVLLDTFLKEEGYSSSLGIEPLSTSLLQSYDLLVVMLPGKNFSQGEMEAVGAFVGEGGGLLLIGDYKDYSREVVGRPDYYSAEALSDLARPFGIVFNRDLLQIRTGGKAADEVEVTDLESHPITRGVQRLSLQGTGTLTLSGEARKVAWGSDKSFSEAYTVVSSPPVVAFSRYGYGYVVAVSDSDLFLSRREVADNKRLVINALDWLIIKPRIRRAEGFLAAGNASLSQRRYEEAERAFGEARALYEELGYKDKITLAERETARAREGVRARTLLEQALEAMNRERYEEAVKGLEEAKELFLGMGDPEKAREADALTVDAERRMRVASIQRAFATRALEILGISIAAFFLFRVLIFRIRRSAENRRIPREKLLGLERVTKYFIAALWLIALLVYFGVVRDITIAAGMVGAALALVLQSLISDLISGVYLAIQRPFDYNDMIKVEEHLGEVVDMGLVSTKIRTRENVIINIPNSIFLSKETINYDSMDYKVRLELHVGVAYKTDLERAFEVIKKTLMDYAEREKNVLPEPEMELRVQGFGDSAINLAVRFYISNMRHSWRITSEVYAAIKEAFEREGIEIPFPQRTVHMKEG